MKLEVYQVDSFTTEPFAGNPAGVVLNADGLSDSQMQQIARELNNSETAFIISRKGEVSADEAYDIEVRFFTPLKEVPICGHATIAAHYVYAGVHNLSDCRIVQKTRAGILPVDIVGEEGDRRVIMTQAGIEFGKILSGEEEALLLEGLGISGQDLDRSLPVQIISTGHSKVMVPVRSAGILDGIVPRNELLVRLSGRIGCNGYYAFTFDSREEGVLTAGRMFAPAVGIPEDPVTGNANGPLGAYLAHNNRIGKSPEGYTFTVKQGEVMGRKGYMNVHVFCRDDEPDLIQVSGRARTVFHTVIDIPSWKKG